LVEASDDRLFRAKAAYHMIRAMRNNGSLPATADGVASDRCGKSQQEKVIVVGA